MEGHRTMVLSPSSSGIGLYAVQDVKSSAAGKQIMKVEKFVQEVRELYTAKSKRGRFKLGDAMSPRVIIRRLSPRTIEQYTRRCRNRVRSGSLSEVDEFSASSYGVSEDETEAAVTQTPDVQTPGQFHRLSGGQAKEKSRGELNKEYVSDPPEGFFVSTSFSKDIVQSDDDDDEEDEDDDISDVLDSDYSGDLPDLTDPSWESPIKTGSRKKSLSKKSRKKKRKRVEDNSKKRKDPKLMKSARKAFEHQRKIFRSTKKYEKRVKDVKESKLSRLSSHKPGTSEPEQSEAQLETMGQQLPNQSPNPPTGVNQDTAVSPKKTSIIHDGSVTPSASDSPINSKKEKIRQLVKANMYKTLTNPFRLFSEKYSVAQCQPQVIGSDKQLSKEGMLLTQDSSQSEGGPVSSLNNPEDLSSGDPKDTGTVDMSEAGQENSAYDSDETVNFEESEETHGNLVTSSNDVLVNGNNNVVKRINRDKSVIDCAVNSNNRKRQRSESVDENCGEARKRIKLEESAKPKGIKVHVPMVIIPSTTIETLVSVAPVSVSSITNVTTATTDHTALQDHSGGSLEVAEKASDIHAARGEKETSSCTSIGKQERKEETTVSIEGSAFMLKSQFLPEETSLEKSEKDKRLPSASPSEVELSATGEKNRNTESTEKSSPDKPINSIKELLSIIMELSNKRTQCEEKIKKIKEDCNKRIDMVETEKREYEKEMEKMVSVMQNWKESSPDKSEANANQESSCNATAQDPLAAGTSQRSTADSAQKTSLQSISQTPTSTVDQDPLVGHTSQGPPSDLASPDTGSLEVQLLTKKKQVSHGASSHKFRKCTSVKTITLTDVGASATTAEKLSSTQKQKKLTINVISAANINRFGKASTSPVKRRSKKSPSKRKAGTSTASQTVPVSSTPSDQHLEELRSQTSRSSSHGTTTVASSGSVLLPHTQPTTQVQSGTSFLWPQGTVPGPQICPNVVVTSLMQNVQQQPTRLQVIQPMLPPRYPPPPYPEHLQTLRAVAPSLNQQFKVVQQGTPDGMQTVSNMQLGAQVHQIQAKAPKPDQQFQIVSVQQQQSLQQPQQQIQQLAMQPLTQHTSSHQLTQSSQSSQLQQLLQQHQQQNLLQQHRTTKQGSKGSKTGHQSHLLVSATPAPTLGGAVARSAQPSQPPPSAVSRSLCGSKSSSQPSTQLSHTPVNSGTELPRALQVTHPVSASVNVPQVAVVEISGQPAAAPLNAAQESPIDFSGGSRNKIASTTNSAILSQWSCFLCGEKGQLLCCNNIVYCSASCQVQDWSRHEPDCSNKQLAIGT